MGLSRREFLLLITAVALPTSRSFAVDETLAVIVHPGVDTKQLTDVDLESIFLTQRRYWAGTKSIVAFNLPPRSPERMQFDEAVLRMNPDTVVKYWIDRRIRSGAPPPRQAPDPLTVVRVVARLQGAIAYVPGSMVTNDVRVVARIRNGKVQPP